MILEERTYRLHPGKTPEYLRNYEEKGLEIQKRILGNLVGYFTSEIGELNCIVHMWGYASLEERTARRAKLQADPAWQAYLPLITPLIQKMDNRILIPTSFSPIR